MTSDYKLVAVSFALAVEHYSKQLTDHQQLASVRVYRSTVAARDAQSSSQQDASSCTGHVVQLQLQFHLSTAIDVLM